MRLSEFIDLFVVALYHHSELNGTEYYRAGEIVRLYGLPLKDSWSTIIWDDFDFSTRVRSARNIGSFADQAVMIAAEGVRWVEDEIGDDNVAAFLEQHGARNPEEPEEPEASDEFAALSAQLAPASDRLVDLSHNKPKRDAISDEIGRVGSAIGGSNLLDPQEKADVLANLNAAQEVVQQSETWFAGAMKYLVFDRVKKAFERTIEDAIRVAVIASLMTLAAIIMAFV